MKNTDSILSPAQKDALILALTEHVKSECSVVNMEQRFRDCLDSCYPEVSVGNCKWQPSHVLETMDPIGFRCGVADHSDAESVYEIEGEYYDIHKVDEARDAFVDLLNVDLTEAREEQEELAAIESHNAEELAEVQKNLDAIELIEAKIEAVENHAF